MALWGCRDVTVTSSASNKARLQVGTDLRVSSVQPSKLYGGLLSGNGKRWWFDSLFDCFRDDGWNKTNPRPRLLYVMESENIKVEYLTLINSPYWSFSFEVVGGEASHVNVLIDADFQKRLIQQSLDFTSGTKNSRPSWWRRFRDKLRRLPYRIAMEILGFLPHNPLALNTDGIDPIGRNIWVHDGIISNSDDSIAVKPSYRGRDANSPLPDCTSNVLIEDMILTGFGASIGSVPPKVEHNCVDGVVFRNITMPGTGRGKKLKIHDTHQDTHSLLCLQVFTLKLMAVTASPSMGNLCLHRSQTSSKLM